jgi:hypothetical protein
MQANEGRELQEGENIALFNGRLRKDTNFDERISELDARSRGTGRLKVIQRFEWHTVEQFQKRFFEVFWVNLEWTSSQKFPSRMILSRRLKYRHS